MSRPRRTSVGGNVPTDPREAASGGLRNCIARRFQGTPDGQEPQTPKPIRSAAAKACQSHGAALLHLRMGMLVAGTMFPNRLRRQATGVQLNDEPLAAAWPASRMARQPEVAVYPDCPAARRPVGCVSRCAWRAVACSHALRLEAFPVPMVRTCISAAHKHHGGRFTSARKRRWCRLDPESGGKPRADGAQLAHEAREDGSG